jgi:hypothetical protein
MTRIVMLAALLALSGWSGCHDDSRRVAECPSSADAAMFKARLHR